MADLVQRLTGALTPADKVAGDTKLPIHGFVGALNEMKRGKLVKADVVAVFGLDTAQGNQLDTLVSLFQDSTEKTEFARVLKDVLYMGESNIVINSVDFRVIATVNTRLQNEITDNGGTVT